MGIKTNSSAISGNNLNPGPGNYNPDFGLARESHVKAGFGTSHRGNNKFDEQPGPGQYDLNKGRGGASWVFGSEEKIRVKRTTNLAAPGPGNYDYKTLFDSNVDKHKGNTMASRRPQSAFSGKTPGPGEYNPNGIPKTKQPSHKIGSENRFGQSQLLESSINPGPGAYDQDNKRRGPKVGFGTDQRMKGTNSYQPGPGQYDPKSGDGGKSYIMGMKTKNFHETNDANNPGPGAYKPSDDFVKENRSVGGKMGHENRKGLEDGKVPGPGAYDNMYDFGKGNTKFAWSKDPKGKQNIDANPGPGSYELKSTIADGQAYQLS